MQKENNSISFVIPAFNASHTLREAVDSIFATNFNVGDEVIIVNDGSRDNTANVATRLQSKYPNNIKLIDNFKNLGCPASRNIGIKEARNRYILSLDSDNLLSENSIKVLRDTILEKKSDIVSFKEVHFFVSDKKKITHKWLFSSGIFSLRDLFSGNFNPGPIGNYMFTKESWEKVGGFSELEKGLHEAWIFTFKQLLSGSKFYISNSGFYYHRYGHDSLTIREYKKNSVERYILESALKNHLNIFEESERSYIKNNTPLWIHKLNSRPIRLKALKIGKNGRLRRTLYGIYCSIVRKFFSKNI